MLYKCSTDHKLIDQCTSMAVSMNLNNQFAKSKQSNQFQKNRKIPISSSSSLSSDYCNNMNNNNHNTDCYSSCCESGWAVLDVIMVISAISAMSFLLYPYVNFTYVKVSEIGSLVWYIMKDEVIENPVIYGCLLLSMVCIGIAAWGIVMCTTRKCGKPKCRGLWKAAEFDIQLETEECVKNSANSKEGDDGGGGSGVKKGWLFELPRDHHRELEAELKKIAPPNGRAVLVFRARCGCSVGRMEVPGPKKARKIKK